MSGPRQPAGPRTGSGPRAPAGAGTTGRSRRGGRTTGPTRASHEAAAPVPTAPEDQPDASAGARGTDELSNWQLLLYQLDRLLRDPTLTRALRASAANLAARVRGLSGATRDALRRLAQALARIRLPFARRLLLGLLALMLPLALLALLSSSDDDGARRSAAEQTARPVPGGAGGPSLPGVGMPDVRIAPAKVPPVRVALVLDGTYDAPALRRELRALGAWLAVNHAPDTRVSLVDAQRGRASAPLRAEDLPTARLGRQSPSTTAAIRSAFARQKGRRLLVTLGTTTPSSTASTLRIATRRGARAGPGSTAALARRRASRVTIDERRPNALAASVARAVMAVSGQREQR
ncbi:MAG: hypothetical protein KY433_03210 [Actinobacteria bacterium]|nr:hypothetical protein [Actinomycetota bacterium]